MRERERERESEKEGERERERGLSFGHTKSSFDEVLGKGGVSFGLLFFANALRESLLGEEEKNLRERGEELLRHRAADAPVAQPAANPSLFLSQRDQSGGVIAL